MVTVADRSVHVFGFGCSLLTVYISVSLVTAAYVSPLRRVPFGKRPKRNQKVSPLTYGPSLRLGVPSLRHSSGGIASGRLRSTSSRCVRLRRTALCAYPRMNASTQPAEGAGGSRSRAAGELTLGLLSGEERGGTPIVLCFSVGVSLLAKAACQPTNLSQVYPIPCGSELARDGGLTGAGTSQTNEPSKQAGR